MTWDLFLERCDVFAELALERRPLAARHYTKDSPLMPAGLLGPVKLMGGR